jgi:hypothetical protein
MKTVARTLVGAGVLASAIIGLGSLIPVQSAHAAVNLVTNGSVENGLTGWTFSGSGVGGFGAVVVPTDGSTPGPFGDVVPPDPFTFSPDAAGTHGVYFVDDAAN